MSVTASRLSPAQGLRYGLFGLPLAFVALPLYVQLPNHYAREFGVPLAALGGVLLVARLLDALLDPLLGRWCDARLRRTPAALQFWVAGACALMAAGLTWLFFPPVRSTQALLAWSAVWLFLTYLGYSAAMVAHQSWGVLLGGDALYQSRVVAWREGLGLAGVLLASVVPAWFGLGVMVALFWGGLLIGWLAWRQAPTPVVGLPRRPGQRDALWLPWRRADFRRLLAVFLCNGIASAVPATLFLFFVQDRLQAPRELEPVLLGSYFLSAALSLPLWLRGVSRLGLVRSWLLGMGLAVAVFVWAALLGEGDAGAFLAVCVLSGAALGSDLVLPGAMLAGIMARAGDLGSAQGCYYGWWNFVSKLNLALAAGLALPLLAWYGYQPGTRTAAGLQSLGIAYCLLPCALKVAAALLLHRFFLQAPAKGTS